MGFTTQAFLFLFFPVCTAAYLAVEWAGRIALLSGVLKRCRAGDWVLIVFSLGFYMWACFDDVFRLCLYILAVYAAGRCIRRSREKGLYLQVRRTGETETASLPRLPLARVPLILSLCGLVLLLAHFRYRGMLTQVWNGIFGDSVEARSVLAPLGISFITFSAISYLVDIYWGKAEAGSLVDCALYLSFFPKVVSGPIVLWRDFQAQIEGRKPTLAQRVDGINRIMIGFAKKLLLADQFGACISRIGDWGYDKVTAWGAVLLYMLQIYYDFAGYSDIAIGLAKLFGFEIKENFNFPYRSRSISEFWRRWHISLGTWFREYVYIPLGGSRLGQRRTLWNLAMVFLLTGIWHGAGWTYMLWGGINGAFVLLERVIQDKKAYQKTPEGLKWAATMFITMMCWELFRFQSIHDCWNWIKVMVGLRGFERIPFTWQYQFDTQVVFFIIVGIFGATVLGDDRVRAWYRRAVSTRVGFAIQEIVLFAVFLIAILFMVNSTYNPFIYFQY